jgi:hypothetical protein
LIICKFADQIFHQSLPRGRKERQIAPQASAGYALSLISLLGIRKAQRGRDKKASKKSQDPPATGWERYAPHDCKQDDFSSGPLKSQEILESPALWLSTNLEMNLIFYVNTKAPGGQIGCSNPGTAPGFLPVDPSLAPLPFEKTILFMLLSWDSNPEAFKFYRSDFHE